MNSPLRYSRKGAQGAEAHTLALWQVGCTSGSGGRFTLNMRTAPHAQCSTIGWYGGLVDGRMPRHRTLSPPRTNPALHQHSLPLRSLCPAPLNPRPLPPGPAVRHGPNQLRWACDR